MNFMQDMIKVREFLNSDKLGRQIVKNFIENNETFATHEKMKKLFS